VARRHRPKLDIVDSRARESQEEIFEVSMMLKSPTTGTWQYFADFKPRTQGPEGF